MPCFERRFPQGALVNCLQSVNQPAVPFGASVLVLADAGLVLVGWVPAFEFIASATQRLCSVHACDPATERGYVYLPGKGDKFYESNTFLIFRGKEGNWLSATIINSGIPRFAQNDSEGLRMAARSAESRIPETLRLLLRGTHRTVCVPLLQTRRG